MRVLARTVAVALLLVAPAAAGRVAPAPPASVLVVPPLVTPPLGPGDRAFPVYGGTSVADTFGALRSDVAGGWHHGDDLFAPLGTPVLACADGRVFSVGWNRVGGWRLWLVDGEGNEFYYAHLSGYSAFGVDGAVVHAGDVLGFVGDTGDASGTPYHLHFEVHPVALLGIGYDGAVDPTSYLRSWRRVDRIPARAAAGWSPSRRGAASGALLLRARDISTAGVLVAGPLARSLRAGRGVEGRPLRVVAKRPSP